MAALKIAYPPDGAKIDLGIAEGSVAPRLALKALGGVPPFAWFVNGLAVGEAALRRQSAWTPDGAGSYGVRFVKLFFQHLVVSRCWKERAEGWSH